MPPQQDEADRADRTGPCRSRRRAASRERERPTGTRPSVVEPDRGRTSSKTSRLPVAMNTELNSSSPSRLWPSHPLQRGGADLGQVVAGVEEVPERQFAVHGDLARPERPAELVVRCQTCAGRLIERQQPDTRQDATVRDPSSTAAAPVRNPSRQVQPVTQPTSTIWRPGFSGPLVDVDVLAANQVVVLLLRSGTQPPDRRLESSGANRCRRKKALTPVGSTATRRYPLLAESFVSAASEEYT